MQQPDARRLPALGKFDTIVMLDVLEHTEDDVATLAALREMLTESGSVVLKVPALPQLYGALDDPAADAVELTALRGTEERAVTVRFDAAEATA